MQMSPVFGACLRFKKLQTQRVTLYRSDGDKLNVLQLKSQST
jgi:hypothetical protein